MLYAAPGAGDVYLGDIGGCLFYIGKAFHTRSRVFADAEMGELDAADQRKSSATAKRQHDAPDAERTQ